VIEGQQKNEDAWLAGQAGRSVLTQNLVRGFRFFLFGFSSIRNANVIARAVALLASERPPAYGLAGPRERATLCGLATPCHFSFFCLCGIFLIFFFICFLVFFAFFMFFVCQFQLQVSFLSLCILFSVLLFHFFHCVF
jgi:hypothetical protein